MADTESPSLLEARRAWQRAEYELAQARSKRPAVAALVQRAERAVDGFGEAIELAMRPRPKEDR